MDVVTKPAPRAVSIGGEELEHATLRELIIARANLGDKVFLHCRGETMSYREADERSNRIANRLLQLGYQRGDVVATFMYNSVDHVLLWFACAKAGLVWAPLNVSLGRDDLIYSLIDTGARLFVVDSELLGAYESARGALMAPPETYVWVSPDSGSVDVSGYRTFEELEGDDLSLPDIVVRPDDDMAIVYTGGSTSMPKGVLVSHLYYLGAALRYRDIVQPRVDDVHFANSHLFHSGGQQFGVTGPLFCGITGAMAKWFSVSKYWDRVLEVDATIIDPLGTMISALLSRPEGPADRRHRVRLGVGIASGQVRRDLRDEFERRYGIPLLEVYSMTELGVLVCSERVDDRRSGSSGRTHGWAEIMIVDDSDLPVPTGQVGEILLRPRDPHCFMKEYINKPIETVASWRNLWYHTGDLGKLDGDGYLYFVGRQAHWIRRRGENVSAFEIEKLITAHDAVLDCAAVGVESNLGEEDIKVYVQLNEGASVTEQDIVEWCRDRIAFFKIPRYVEFVDVFPRTITKNEIARHELKQRGVGDAWDSESGRPE